MRISDIECKIIIVLSIKINMLISINRLTILIGAALPVDRNYGII